MPTYRIQTPATSANLGPGFDCLGLALSLYNDIEISTDADELNITITGVGQGVLPTDADNLSIQAMRLLYQRVGLVLPPLSVKMHNRIPLGSGLGSSAAAIVGGLVGANTLLGTPLAPEDILSLAVEMEHHPDNVTPALYGGLTVSTVADGDLIFRKIDVPPITAVVAMPRIFVSTAQQRAVLPATINYSDAVANLGYVGLVIKALMDGDIELLCRAMSDRMHVPYRRAAIPGYDAVEAAAKGADAAVTISGAGPSVIAFGDSDYETLGQLMVAAFECSGKAKADYWVLPVQHMGTVAEIRT